MNALLKGVKGSQDASTKIKSVITTQLSQVVKEIQLSCVEENILGDSLDVEEATNSLCCIIESIFLHGLKDSLALRFRKALADIDDRPVPNFWAPLLVISHRQIIDLILKCPHLSTEVGQCRAWIRLALNDCLLSSYFMTLRQNSNLLKSYYNTYAYVRDGDLLEVAQKLIEGVEAVKTFDLPCYSSILNTWPQTTLILAGVWAPTLRAAPVQSCIDVAQSTTQSSSNLNSETASLGSVMSLHSRNSGIGSIVALNEEEAFKAILNKKLTQEVEDEINMSDSKYSNDTDEEVAQAAEEELGNIKMDKEQTLGNSLAAKSGWSFDETMQKDLPTTSSPVDMQQTRNIESSAGLEQSFNALIQSYNMFSGAYIKTPDIKEVWQHIQNNSESSKLVTESERKVIVEQETRDETNFSKQLTQIAKEIGLDRQNYECAGCGVTIASNKTNVIDANFANVCAFSGKYFCTNCMCATAISVPARMIHNWDYREYMVSREAFDYIESIKDHPCIDLKTANPYIYGVIEDMSRLQILRNQLNFLRAYLYTCRDPVIEEFQKLLFPREYMYEHVHQYSILDLLQIPDGTLSRKLKEVVYFAKNHVLDCWLCSHKGFLCEVCNSSKVLFPFDVDNVYRCDCCNAVYHKGCLDATKPCPKCKRQREREDMSLLGMTDDND